MDPTPTSRLYSPPNEKSSSLDTTMRVSNSPVAGGASKQYLQYLAYVYWFKIIATVCFWSLPLLCFPSTWLQALWMANRNDASAFLSDQTILFQRLLGWAYLALCVGYAQGLHACSSPQQPTILPGPILVGLVSNSGACLWLLHGMVFTSLASQAHPFLQFVLWSSIVATAFITWGLYVFGAVPWVKQNGY